MVCKYMYACVHEYEQLLIYAYAYVCMPHC